ncbi:hypothetical protein ACE102_07395 [Bradyrhizobium sp. vgs-9]|uniref:hypothetical protein n=1 Tax=Bradyrhizobium sp. vgs-9 TaxID=208389 RepID=UPI0035D3F146
MSTVEVGQDTDVSTPLAGESVTVVTDYQVEVIQELEQGPPGPQGPPGAPSTIAGPPGPQGTPGNTVLYGSVDPVNSDGRNGDFYINTTTHFIFGPKAANIWPAGTSLIGPQGIPGNTVLYGTADPTGAVGVDGNFYINTTTHFMFGPKASGAWPAGTSLVGPQGPQGIQGIQGIQGATGQRGSLFYTGAGAPGTISGQLDGDNYLNSTNGDVYTLTSGAWGSPVGNIRGPQGIQGPPGAVPETPSISDGIYYTRRNGAWVDAAGAFVRFDVAQSLTTGQQGQARSNIGVTAIGSSPVGQIVGTTGAQQPLAGNVGERIYASLGWNFTGSGVVQNGGSITVTPGVWDLELCAVSGGPGATSTSDIQVGISTTNNGSPNVGVNLHYRLPAATDVSMMFIHPRWRVAVTANTSYFGVMIATFTGASYGGSGYLQATRVS